ncbi:unnamed protein product [Hyaloperonospora brassicae]|uniref:RxLR effector candidate protein n=1 Tax=Hyaloperonospora brassicae TaxID=162125 RepID=A0AAV0U6N6_HYABA|nr:unnamed protein product [Hyaloperonospora brassicae]CAI5731335.1 unnamed protein product [Hyaloperonospora brassicae]
MRFIFAAALAVAFALVSTPSTAASVAEPSGASQIAPLGPDHREGKVSGLGEGRHHVRPDRPPTAVLSAQNEEARFLPEAFGSLGALVTSAIRKLLRLFNKGGPRLRKETATLKNKAKYKQEVASIKGGSYKKRWKMATSRWRLNR